jgi:hypothetical protein
MFLVQQLERTAKLTFKKGVKKTAEFSLILEQYQSN